MGNISVELLFCMSSLGKLGVFLPSIVGAEEGGGGGGEDVERSRDAFKLGLPPSLASANCFSMAEIEDSCDCGGGGGSCCMGAILFSVEEGK